MRYNRQLRRVLLALALGLLATLVHAASTLETADYERAAALRQSARAGGSPVEREKQLVEAGELLARFLAQHPDHSLAAKANNELAELLAAQGQIKAQQAALPNRSPDEKLQLLARARELYQQAQKLFEASEKRLAEVHGKFPQIIDPKETRLLQQRDEVRREWLAARLALPTVVYEIAHTFEPGSQENKDHLQSAAQMYNALYKKQSNRLAGLRARLGEGCCYKELGDLGQALSAFEDLVSLLEEPEGFRALKNQAMVLYLETALNPKIGKYQEAVDKCQAWVKTAGPAEQSSAEGLAIKYLAGEAAFILAKAAQEDDAAGRAGHLKTAKTLLAAAARETGPYQKRAQAALERPELGGEKAAPADAAPAKEPTSFAEAHERGREALERLQDTELTPAEIAQVRAEAMRFFQMALTLRRPDVSVDEVNAVRYYLAYLHWTADNLYEAAALGEFLARRYPQAAAARPAAKIALAAYAKLLGAAPPADRKFESERMLAMAHYIAATWKGEAEADDAWLMLLQTAISSGQFDKAQEYLEQVPADSPRRGEIEMTAGRKAWAEYLLAARKPPAERPAQAQLDTMVRQAQQMLESGIGRTRKLLESGGQVSENLLAAVLSLAQVHVGAGEAAKAVQWLENPQLGPLTLVAADHPLTTQTNFRVETYKAALRAYVATQELAKAENVVKALEARIKQEGDSEASAKLTRIYIGLGRELQEQLQQLRSERRTAQLEKVSHAFELFLDRIAQRKEGNTFNSLTWVAETFYGMGAGFDPGGSKLTAQAEKYYGKAAATYQNIVALCEEKKLDAQPNALLGVKIRLANCLRRQGQYNEAMKRLVEILRVHPTLVDAQVEAAYTFQAMGAEKAGYYLLAIQGGSKHKDIWGWTQIALRVARDEKRKAVFHEACYNRAECRFKLAQTTSKDQRQAMLRQAENDILVIQRLYPEMGGPLWYAKYDELLKKVQVLRGVTAAGLRASAAKEKSPPARAAVKSK